MISERRCLEIEIHVLESQIEKLESEIREARRFIVRYEEEIKPRKDKLAELIHQEELYGEKSDEDDKA